MNYREMSKSHNEHLTNDSMILTAPSIFSEAPRGDVSARYGFLPTIQIVDALRAEGWLPVDAVQKNVRNKDNTDFTKHLVRFRRLGDDIKVGDSVVELLLTNSHDRTAAFQLHAGIFRMACANGIVIADSTFNKVSVRHNQNAAEQVVEGSYQVIDEVPLITNEVESMQNTMLTQNEQFLLAKTVLDYTTPEAKEGDAKIITSETNIVEQMLRPNRNADTGLDLWSTYNVIQEKVLRGGIRTAKRNAKGQYKRNTTREVKSIDKNVKLNKALWEMATAFRDLKAA